MEDYLLDINHFLGYFQENIDYIESEKEQYVQFMKEEINSKDQWMEKYLEPLCSEKQKKIGMMM